MTTHQLAALLLTKPDEPVYISVHRGNDELMEVKDVASGTDDWGFTGLELKVYKEQR